MHISRNTTGMLAALTMATDKTSRDWCVLVIKGTYSISSDGKSTISDIQAPFVFADEHYGDPATTSIRAECDFARFKPRADFILRGHAVGPSGRAVTEVDVTLQIGAVNKSARVTGNRVWQSRLVALKASPPEPFTQMPLIWERSYGGTDRSDPERVIAELHNPLGVGFSRRTMDGHPLPNIDSPGKLFRSASDSSPPVGFGVVGRSWQPRIKFAGTYDAAWLEHQFPFLPKDFDDQHFQSAPIDQQLSYPSGGEAFRCTGVRADGPFVGTLPVVDLPVVFRFRNRNVQVRPVLDTIIALPDDRQIVLCWRVQVQLGRKLTELREVLVGPSSLLGKPHYPSLNRLTVS